MRRYDDPVEVRRGPLRTAAAAAAGADGPDQFLWRGRLWQVRAVVAHWVETGAWWQAGEPAADEGGAACRPVGDLLDERELWRVEARRGPADPGGVFDLAFSWSQGSWQLVGCQD